MDNVARQGFANLRFETDIEEGLDVMDEFYIDESLTQKQPPDHKLLHIQDIRQGLQQSFRAVN